MLYNVLGMLGNVLSRPRHAFARGRLFRCGTPKMLQKHTEVDQGRYQACLGRCKACLRYPQLNYRKESPILILTKKQYQK